MLSIYLETGCCDDAALATMFAICSIALYFLPWTDNLLHQFPDPASVKSCYSSQFYKVQILNTLRGQGYWGSLLQHLCVNHGSVE